MGQVFSYALNQAVIRDFKDRGFVVTPDVFDLPTLNKYGQAVDEEVRSRTANDTRTLDEKTRYEQSFVQCMRLWETHPGVADLSFHSGLAGIAAQLLEVSGLLMWQDQALYKEPGGQQTTPHQDQTFWPIGTSPLISAWIPFEDVTVASGAMAYVPGSHKVGKLQVVDITHATEPYDILTDPALEQIEPEYVEIQAGSVIWHHGFTVHQAAPNLTQQTRRVFTVVYISDQARRAKNWANYPLDRAGVAVGERIEGEGLPRVWPPTDSRPDPARMIGRATGPQ
ncbi:MAG: phytanoyl-CoA dioxygenase family protein [Pseudomonadota bacterium]